jgi:prepilin-type N-terminal cleavage/methylation domain-containing protein/prepilin-type processing-associated H-X9-DG protein
MHHGPITIPKTYMVVVSCKPARARKAHRCGFTLIELMIVVSIIVVLAGMLSPALAKAKGKAHRTVCLNQMKQLSLCWTMYAQDNNGRLTETYSFDPSGGLNTNTWVRGSMDDSPAYGPVEAGKSDSTNVNTIVQGKLFTYNQSVGLYRCPSDRSSTKGVPRVRSTSINGWMGGRPLAGQDEYRVFTKETDITSPGPSQTFVFIDEHEKSINDGWFAVDMRGNRGFIDAPASRHDRAFTLSFADGHVEVWKIQDARTIQWEALPISNNPLNADWDRLHMVSTSLQ